MTHIRHTGHRHDFSSRVNSQPSDSDIVQHRLLPRFPRFDRTQAFPRAPWAVHAKASPSERKSRPARARRRHQAEGQRGRSKFETRAGGAEPDKQLWNGRNCGSGWMTVDLRKILR